MVMVEFTAIDTKIKFVACQTENLLAKMFILQLFIKFLRWTPLDIDESIWVFKRGVYRWMVTWNMMRYFFTKVRFVRALYWTLECLFDANNFYR